MTTLHNNRYRGDIGLLRRAIDEIDIDVPTNATIFNDRHKSTGRRRLKLWKGDKVFKASQEKQRALDTLLKDFFEQRYLGGYFIKTPPWSGGSVAFCITLEN